MVLPALAKSRLMALNSRLVSSGRRLGGFSHCCWLRGRLGPTPAPAAAWQPLAEEIKAVQRTESLWSRRARAQQLHYQAERFFPFFLPWLTPVLNSAARPPQSLPERAEIINLPERFVPLMLL